MNEVKARAAKSSRQEHQSQNDRLALIALFAELPRVHEPRRARQDRSGRKRRDHKRSKWRPFAISRGPRPAKSATPDRSCHINLSSNPNRQPLNLRQIVMAASAGQKFSSSSTESRKIALPTVWRMSQRSSVRPMSLCDADTTGTNIRMTRPPYPNSQSLARGIRHSHGIRPKRREL